MADRTAPTRPPEAQTARLEDALHRVEHTEGLDEVATRVLDPIAQRLEHPRLRAALGGAWLGHPVHPPLTDVTLGLLNAGTLLGAAPTSAAQRYAGAFTAAGLGMAVPTALTGLHDWKDLRGPRRRVGVAHAIVNDVGLFAMGASLVSRLRGRRGRANAYGWAGYLVLLVGGFLGGHLSFRKGVGVDVNAFASGPQEWTDAAAFDELGDGALHGVEVEGRSVVLRRRGATVEAIGAVCNHKGAPLQDGELDADAGTVTCPWHGSVFRLRDGACLAGPAPAPQPLFDTRVVDGRVQVRAAG